MINAVFWNVAPCRFYVNRRFGGTYRLHPEAIYSRWFLNRGFFYPEDGGDRSLRNVGSHKIYTAPHPSKWHSLRMYLIVVECFLMDRGICVCVCVCVP
jgi:hypothetical protein